MLRASILLGTLSLPICLALSGPAPANADILQYLPFFTPSAQTRPAFLLKRQSCPSGHTSCSNLNAPNACCPSGTSCARDERGNIACCPDNNYCTGVIGSAVSSSGVATPTSGETTGFAGTVTVISTAGVTGQTLTTPASITGSVAGGGSTVPNAYFPFVYIPTSFGNAAICSQYYTSCQVASTSCFQSLAGANGVTVGGIGGGTTQAGSSGVVQVSASSICSSLSQQACLGLQTTQCSQIGSTGATGSGFVQAGRGPRETGCPRMVYIAAAGAVAAGAMGVVV